MPARDPHHQLRLFAMGRKLGRIRNLQTLKKKLAQLDKMHLSASDKEDVALSAWHEAVRGSPHSALIRAKYAEFGFKANKQSPYTIGKFAEELVRAALATHKSQKEIAGVLKSMPKKLTENQQTAFMNMAYQTADRGSLSEAILATRYFGTRLKIDACDTEAAWQLEEWKERLNKRQDGVIL